METAKELQNRLELEGYTGMYADDLHSCKCKSNTVAFGDRAEATDYSITSSPEVAPISFEGPVYTPGTGIIPDFTTTNAAASNAPMVTTTAQPSSPVTQAPIVPQTAGFGNTSQLIQLAKDNWPLLAGAAAILIGLSSKKKN